MGTPLGPDTPTSPAAHSQLPKAGITHIQEATSGSTHGGGYMHETVKCGHRNNTEDAQWRKADRRGHTPESCTRAWAEAKPQSVKPVRELELESGRRGRGAGRKSASPGEAALGDQVTEVVAPVDALTVHCQMASFMSGARVPQGATVQRLSSATGPR